MSLVSSQSVGHIHAHDVGMSWGLFLLAQHLELSLLFNSNIPCLPHILLLNNTFLNLTFHKKRVLFAGLTAAKKMLTKRWKPLHVLNVYLWKLSFYEALSLEISSACAQRAKTEAIQNLESVFERVRALF